MEILEKGKTKYVTLRPGEYYVSNQASVISTLLGSCISACLYDPGNRVIGMNHFLLSSKRYAKEMPICTTEAGRYGVHAMELVINGMLKIGAERQNLRAKAFGGGSLFQAPGGSDNFFCVGEVNMRFILEFLRNDGIPLISSDLGGEIGRVIRFSSDDFSVTMKRIRKSRRPELLQEERKFWQSSLEIVSQRTGKVDLWG
jgi:chemotaxis protein CheD